MKREIRVIGDLAFIPLSQGYEAVIDAADVTLVMGFNWTAKVTPWTVYVGRNETLGGKLVLLRLHRVLLNAPLGVHVDHINGDGLDNRRVNLRLATNAENGRNQRRHANNACGFKGVYWHKRGKKWAASIGFNGQNKHLGLFNKPESAHAAYCEAAALLHGEFARTE